MSTNIEQEIQEYISRGGTVDISNWPGTDTPQFQSWMINGTPHRENGPTFMMYNQDGTPRYEEWHRDGLIHRVDGPADIIYHPDGRKRSEKWYLDGLQHRESGPSTTIWNENGKVVEQRWYLDGVELTEEAFLAYTEMITQGVPKEWAKDAAKNRSTSDSLK